MKDALREVELIGAVQVQWKFLGVPVCLRSWMRLHSLGCSSKSDSATYWLPVCFFFLLFGIDLCIVWCPIFASPVLTSAPCRRNFTANLNPNLASLLGLLIERA